MKQLAQELAVLEVLIKTKNGFLKVNMKNKIFINIPHSRTKVPKEFYNKLLVDKFEFAIRIKLYM